MNYWLSVKEVSVVYYYFFSYQKYVKYVRNLLSITACGDHCVLATRADDSSGQVTDQDTHALVLLIDKHTFLKVH